MKTSNVQMEGYDQGFYPIGSPVENAETEGTCGCTYA